MPVTVVVGTQWGDEGKAKVIDLLAGSHSHVVRYQGGHNAGHTLKINGGPADVVRRNRHARIARGLVQTFASINAGASDFSVASTSRCNE